MRPWAHKTQGGRARVFRVKGHAMACGPPAGSLDTLCKDLQGRPLVSPMAAFLLGRDEPVDNWSQVQWWGNYVECREKKALTPR